MLPAPSKASRIRWASAVTSDELHRWAFAVRGSRALHGMEGGTTGPDDDVAAESLQNIGATSTPLPRNSSISTSENAST
jgi:hypothetical protein